MQIETIFENNKTWAAEKLSVDADYFENLAKGQDPDVVYIGCSDSRVTAEDMMGAEPGDLFVHRNIANVIATNDVNATSVITYAVEHLHVKHLVVCGHYGCGGVAAAMEAQTLGDLNPWLRNIRDVYRLHAEEINGIEDREQRYRRHVELNVEEQCVNALKLPCVISGFMSGSLDVHGWVFDIRTGRINDLRPNIGEVVNVIKEIYRAI